MSGLKLGDLILDPRRMVYIPSLRAVACTGLHEALHIGIGGGLRGVLERVDAILNEYTPDALMILGGLRKGAPIEGIARRWGKTTKILLVTKDSDSDLRERAESLGCEVHNEVVWGKYRFAEREDKASPPEIQMMSIVGEPHYVVKVGNSPFGGMKFAVFLKTSGRLVLPSINPASPNGSAKSVFTPELERYDIFAVGHQRVLPLGKVADVKLQHKIARGIPFTKSTLAAGRLPLRAGSREKLNFQTD